MARFTHSEKQQRVRVLTAGVVGVVDADEVLFCDASAGAINANLPVLTTSHLGLEWVFSKQDASGNAVNINASGGNQIDGAASVSLLAQYDTVTLVAVRNGGGVLSWTLKSTNSTGGSGSTSGYVLGFNRLWVM